MSIIYLVTWMAFVSVPAACTDRRPGCAVMHSEQVKREGMQLFFIEEDAKKFCDGKENCRVSGLDEKSLNDKFAHNPEKGKFSIWQ